MNSDTFLYLSNLLYIALALAALWITGRMVLRNLTLLQITISSSRAIQLLIWLALGYIFTLPFIDFLGLIQTIAPLSDDVTWEFNTFWGSVSPLIYGIYMEVILLLIYSLTVILGWNPLIKRTPPILEAIKLNSFEKVFSLFAIAGLINQIVRFVLMRVIWPQGPLEVDGFGKGIPGFTAGWLVGLLIVAITIYVMSELIDKQTDKMDDISD